MVMDGSRKDRVVDKTVIYSCKIEVVPGRF